MSVEPALLDTNILADATDEGRVGHENALALLTNRPGLVLCAQVAREYLVIATRPTIANGLGLSLDDALDNLAEFRTVARLLPEEKPLLPKLLSLLAGTACRGATIHDAHLVAAMLVHDVSLIITSNTGDFKRFSDQIQLLEPSRALV